MRLAIWKTKSSLGCSGAPDGTGAAPEEVREILRNAVRDERAPRKPLGSRLRDRFAGIGLENELPELRDEVAQPATLET